jgi:hypothetical protein
MIHVSDTGARRRLAESGAVLPTQTSAALRVVNVDADPDGGPFGPGIDEVWSRCARAD